MFRESGVGNKEVSHTSQREYEDNSGSFRMNLLSGSTAIPGQLEKLRVEPRVAKITPLHSEASGRDVHALEDRELVAEGSAGNSAAFDELVSRYRDKVLRLVISVLGSEVEAEDVVQEIFIKIYLSLHRFRGDASFSTYLYTVSINRCRDELRKAKLRRFFSFDDWFARNGTAHPSEENGQQVERDERRSAVRKAMRRLPAETQMLLYLREIEELSYKELADVFEVEIGTIKSRLARGRERLREQLLPYMERGAMPQEADEDRNNSPVTW